jgi:RecB family exonuclease
MRHVLGVEPLTEPEEALTLPPVERGSLYHEVLESFMRGARESGALPLSPDQRERLFQRASLIGRSDDWSLAAVEGARELELKNLLSGLSLWFAYELMDDTGFVPTYFEARFGGQLRAGDDPDLSIEEGVALDVGGTTALLFGGKIDRIDVTQDGSRARVIDYKTGKQQSKGGKILDRGRRLQLPVYLLATERMLRARDANATVETAEYLYVSSHEAPSSMAFTRVELERASEDLAAAIGLIVHGITSGMFITYPPAGADCRYCDYADACGSTALALATMKNGDKHARFFVEDLVEIK